MKAARRRNSGTGDDVKEWNRSSGANLNGLSAGVDGAKAGASDSSFAFEVKVLTDLFASEVDRFGLELHGVECNVLA
jgi:hypothetical protein